MKYQMIAVLLFSLAGCSKNEVNHYLTKPNNLPQLDCEAHAVYSVNPPNIKGNLSITPVASSSNSTDSAIVYNNSGNGYLGASIEISGGNPLHSVYNYRVTTRNTTPAKPFPSEACTVLNADDTSSIYKGSVMYWTNCQASVENGIMNFSADYQIVESTGATIKTGKLSFNCSTKE
jgi:hypothetical protein